MIDQDICQAMHSLVWLSCPLHLTTSYNVHLVWPVFTMLRSLSTNRVCFLSQRSLKLFVLMKRVCRPTVSIGPCWCQCLLRHLQSESCMLVLHWC